jgi:hypothetical protein
LSVANRCLGDTVNEQLVKREDLGRALSSLACNLCLILLVLALYYPLEVSKNREKVSRRDMEILFEEPVRSFCSRSCSLAKMEISPSMVAEEVLWAVFYLLRPDIGKEVSKDRCIVFLLEVSPR